MRHVAVALVALLLLGGCKQDLYGRLSEREANEIVAVLQRAGIATERLVAKDRSVTVRVPAERFADAVEALRPHGLPRQAFASMGEVFAGGGLVSSPLEERARLLHALSQELSRTVSEIDGVVSARVHLVLAETDALRQTSAPAAASVFIRHEPAAAIAALTPQIKTLVSNSVAGLSYERVSVVLVPAAPRPGPLVAVSAPAASPWLPAVPQATTLIAMGIGLIAAVGGAALLFARPQSGGGGGR